MNSVLKTTLLASSMVLVSMSSTVIADEADYERGYANGLHALEDRMNYKFGKVNNAIDENTADIGANTSAINDNSAAIGTNSSAIGDNAAAIAALQAGKTTYDYRDYVVADNVSKKTYNLRNISDCDTETRTYERATNGHVTDITMTRVRTTLGADCRYHKFMFRNTPEGRYRVGTQSFNKSGTTLKSTVILDNPALMRSTSMEIGKSIADGTSTTVTDGLGNSLPSGTYVHMYTLAGIESVTVPYNGGTTFEGCAKFHISHNASVGFGTGLIDRMEWHCPGVGMVKRIHGNGGYYELTGIDYQ